MVSVVVVQHVGNFFAQNSRQVIIHVLGPVLRTRIKDAYYDSTVFHYTGTVCVIRYKSEFSGYNVVITRQHSAHLEKCPPS